MPQFLEAKLEKGAEKGAEKKGFSGKRADRYVYGALNNMGAMRGSKITAKGKRMQKKHERKMSGKLSEMAA